jgi:dTDP-4-dehydrorhamnose reductase
MRILVTGVTGQVGGALLKVLEPAAFIIAADHKELDLALPDLIAAALNRIRPDLIVNAAAYTAVDRAEDEKEIAFRINAEAPRVIAQWAADRGVPIVHFSTDYVFDGVGVTAWREDDPAKPLSIYGASKLAGDDAVRSAGGPHLIVRTSWVYAANGTNFLQTIVRLAKERKELRIVADQFGAPTSARLIADAVARIVGDNRSHLPECFVASKGLVNVVASGQTSWHGFAVAIVEGLRTRGVTFAIENIVPIATRDYPTKARRPANSRLDLTRLRQVFQIQPPRWDQALAVELDKLAVELVK